MMWVRNPYARLLSAFLDKVLGKFRDLPITAALGGPFEDSPSEFARFVRGVLDARSRGVVHEVHWQLQTETCGLSEGVKYHFYLKEEEVNTWYVELMSALWAGWGRQARAASGAKQVLLQGGWQELPRDSLPHHASHAERHPRPAPGSAALLWCGRGGAAA